MARIPPIMPYPMPDGTELPANIARWTADPARAVLLIHDMQRYFWRLSRQGCHLAGNSTIIPRYCVTGALNWVYR